MGIVLFYLNKGYFRSHGYFPKQTFAISGLFPCLQHLHELTVIKRALKQEKLDSQAGAGKPTLSLRQRQALSFLGQMERAVPRNLFTWDFISYVKVAHLTHVGHTSVFSCILKILSETERQSLSASLPCPVSQLCNCTPLNATPQTQGERGGCCLVSSGAMSLQLVPPFLLHQVQHSNIINCMVKGVNAIALVLLGFLSLERGYFVQFKR